jgi:hypothetical protein
MWLKPLFARTVTYVKSGFRKWLEDLPHFPLVYAIPGPASRAINDISGSSWHKSINHEIGTWQQIDMLVRLSVLGVSKKTIIIKASLDSCNS